MVQQIRPAKYVPETISYFVDFSDFLQPGEVITGTPVITILVVDGEDNNPSSMLYGNITVVGNTVEQRIKEGIAGNIYSITFSITTTGGNTYEKEFYLAILPVTGDAIPSFQTIWFTSCLYPYQLSDTLIGYTVLGGGTLVLTKYSYEEAINSFIFLVGGILASTGTQVPYSYEEGLEGTSILTSGILFSPNQTSYSFNDSLDGQRAMIGGILFGGGITYSIPADTLIGSTILIDGTLT